MVSAKSVKLFPDILAFKRLLSHHHERRERFPPVRIDLPNGTSVLVTPAISIARYQRTFDEMSDWRELRRMTSPSTSTTPT